MSALALASRSNSSRYGRAALDSEAYKLELSTRGSRHKDIFVAACRVGELVGGGELDRELAHVTLVRAGELLKPGSRSEVEKTVRRGIERGSSHPRSAPSGGRVLSSALEARLAAHELLEAVASHPEEFTGVAGGSDLRVLVALTLTAIAAGKLRLGFSVRQLAEVSGLGHSTVHRSLHRLEGRWLRRVHVASQRESADRSRIELTDSGVKRDPRETAGEYQLLARRGAKTGQAGGTSWGVERQCPMVAVLPPSGLIEGLSHPAHDLWRRRSSAWRLYSALACEPETGRSAGELADALSMPRRTVFRNLRWLAAVGIIDHLDGLYQLVSSPAEALAVHSIPPWREINRMSYRLDRRIHKIRLAMNARWGRHHRGDLDSPGLGAELRRLSEGIFEVLEEREAVTAWRQAAVAASTLPRLTDRLVPMSMAC